MPLAAARWLENTLPAARLDVFAHSAHVPFLSDPTRFATALNQFRQDHLTPATEIPAPC
jgi:pimeloyl-ACP methyl ester carboxylesterase